MTLIAQALIAAATPAPNVLIDATVTEFIRAVERGDNSSLRRIFQGRVFEGASPEMVGEAVLQNVLRDCKHWRTHEFGNADERFVQWICPNAAQKVSARHQPGYVVRLVELPVGVAAHYAVEPVFVGPGVPSPPPRRPALPKTGVN